MGLITYYYKDEGIEVSGNLDDSEYQQQVMNLAPINSDDQSTSD